jgi:hypothetical protein
MGETAVKTKRSVFTRKSVAALFALVLTLAVTTAALAAPSIARFDAAGVVLGVGPGPEFDVSTRFVRTGRDRDLKLVIIRTSDEQVGGALVPGVTSCQDRDGGASCASTSGLLTGSGLLSLHDSTAILSNISVHPHPDPFLASLGLDAASGSINGVLNGDFTIANLAGTANGKALLRIEGSATYGCFASLAPLAPAPISVCEAGNGLFVPLALNVVDKGSFTMNNFTGAFTDLAHLGGRLEVTVNGATGVPGVPVGTISVTDGKAVFH